MNAKRRSSLVRLFLEFNIPNALNRYFVLLCSDDLMHRYVFSVE